MRKAELRKKYLAKRKQLNSSEVEEFSQRIFATFLQIFELKAGSRVHIFLSIPHLNEVQTGSFIEYCLENGVQVFVPKIEGDKMISVQISAETVYSVNSWGISEPESETDAHPHFDFVITPLLYCDSKGNRVGYGKGFYDRFFSKINQNVQKIGVNFFPPKEFIEDVFESDIALDYLVLPDKMLSFRGLL